MYPVSRIAVCRLHKVRCQGCPMSPISDHDGLFLYCYPIRPPFHLTLGRAVLPRHVFPVLHAHLAVGILISPSGVVTHSVPHTCMQARSRTRCNRKIIYVRSARVARSESVLRASVCSHIGPRFLTASSPSYADRQYFVFGLEGWGTKEGKYLGKGCTKGPKTTFDGRAVGAQHFSQRRSKCCRTVAPGPAAMRCCCSVPLDSGCWWRLRCCAPWLWGKRVGQFFVGRVTGGGKCDVGRPRVLFGKRGWGFML